MSPQGPHGALCNGPGHEAVACSERPLSARCCRPRASAFWRLRRGAAGGARQGLMLWRSSRSEDSTAMLALGSRRTTHFARFALCVQTGATSQFTKRASHADPRPALLVATEIAPTGHRPPRCNACGSCRKQRPRPSKGAFGQDGARLWGAEKVSPGASGPGDRLRLANGRAYWPGAACKARARGPARSASCPLTRRGCPNAANAVSEVSSATGPRGRASQGSLSGAKTAPVKRSGLPGRAFAAPDLAREADIQGQQWAERRPPGDQAAGRVHLKFRCSSPPAPRAARRRAAGCPSP